MEMTKEEFDSLIHHALTEDIYLDLDSIDLDLLSSDIKAMSRDEHILTLERLLEHAEYSRMYQKQLNYKLSSKMNEVKRLKKLLSEDSTNSTDNQLKGQEYSEPFYSDYLREGYKIIMPVGSILIEDTEGNKKAIAKTDGDWHETRIHEVIKEDPMLTVVVTEEQEDGSYIEIDRYKISK